MKFRKKPVVIDAVLFDGKNGRMIQGWSWELANRNGLPKEPAAIQDKGAFLRIETLEGVHRAQPGDWIICGVKGEFYPCKPDIFEQTYDTVFGDDAG